MCICAADNPTTGVALTLKAGFSSEKQRNVLRQACSTSGELAGSGASIPGAGTEAGVPRREALAVLLTGARAAVCVQDERLAVTLCCGCPRDTVPLGCGAAPVQASGGRGRFQLSFVPVPPAPGVCWGSAGIFPEPTAPGISHFHAVSPRDVREAGRMLLSSHLPAGTGAICAAQFVADARAAPRAVSQRCFFWL